MAAPLPEPISEIGRLDSWKQIAGYLDKSERTVRRWSQTEGLPVHKHLHQQRGSVWAYQQELDDWLAQRRVSPEPLDDVPEPPPNRIPWAYLSITALAIATASAGWFLTHRPPEILPESVPFTALPGMESSPSFSPDGRKVVFQWGKPTEGGLYIKEVESEKVTPLLVSGQLDFDPAWSPNGKTIAFIRRTPERETWLYLIAATGGPEQQLALLAPAVSLYGNHKHLSWSPDSQWILAPMNTPGKRVMNISRIGLNGEARPLTDPLDSATLYSSQMALDGHAFVYLRRFGPVTSGLRETEVVIQKLNIEGNPEGKPQSLYKADLSPNGIAWVPDGKSLVFCTEVVGLFGSRLFRLPAEVGGELKPISTSDCTTVSVSRADSSGKAMLLYGSSNNQKVSLLQGNVDSLGSPIEFAPSSRKDTLPSFSPNGEAVAFTSNRSGRPEIWIAKQDGSEARRVTEKGQLYSKPEWSPDGNSLAYVSASSKGRSLTIAPIAGGSPKIVSQPGGAVQDPVWSRDGKFLYYSTGSDIWRCRVDGTDRVKLVENVNIPIGESPDGESIYMLKGVRRHFALIRMPRNGGTPEVLTDGLMKQQFAMTKTAIYFVRTDEGTFHQFSFQTGAIKDLGILLGQNQKRAGVIAGLTVSPDDKKVIWAAGEGQQLDLELIRNFR